VLALLALLTIGLTACTRDKEPSTDSLPAGATLISDAAVAMRNVQSAHMRIETEGEVASLPMRRAEGDLLRSGDAKGTIQLAQSGVLVEYEFVLLGESIYLKGVTGGWQQLPAAVAATIYDPSAILDPDRGVVKVLTTATEPTTEAKEPVDGVEAYRVGVKLDNTAVGSLVPGVPPGVTGKLWIAETTKHLLKAVLTVPGQAGGTVTISFSAFDAPVTVSAP
jgi:lipoprotein LprG